MESIKPTKKMKDIKYWKEAHLKLQEQHIELQQRVVELTKRSEKKIRKLNKETKEIMNKIDILFGRLR